MNIEEAIKKVIDYGLTVTNHAGGYIKMDDGRILHQRAFRSSDYYNEYEIEEAIESFVIEEKYGK